MHYLQRHRLVLLVGRVLYAHSPSSPVHPVLVLLVVMHVAKVVEGGGVTGMEAKKGINFVKLFQTMARVFTKVFKKMHPKKSNKKLVRTINTMRH